VGAGEALASGSYEIANIAQQVNFINVMTYDFAMASDGKTGFNSPQAMARMSNALKHNC